MSLSFSVTKNLLYHNYPVIGIGQKGKFDPVYYTYMLLPVYISSFRPFHDVVQYSTGVLKLGKNTTGLRDTRVSSYKCKLLPSCGTVSGIRGCYVISAGYYQVMVLREGYADFRL